MSEVIRTVGPDMSICHMVVTWKLEPRVFETQVFRLDPFGNAEAAPSDEWTNDNYKDALMAHAVAFEACCKLERRGKLWPVA